MKYGLYFVGVIIILIILVFGIEMLGLQWTKFFKPKYQNVEREVFEQTKSYVHGKIQDLAKNYKEYNNPDTPEDEKRAIASLIPTEFADLDTNDVKNTKLKAFLIEKRGY